MSKLEIKIKTLKFYKLLNHSHHALIALNKLCNGLIQKYHLKIRVIKNPNFFFLKACFELKLILNQEFLRRF